MKLSLWPGATRVLAVAALAVTACSPAAPAAPTAAPAKPAPASSPAAAPAASPAAAASPATKPSPSPSVQAQAKPAAAAAANFDVKAVEDFYRGKTVRILVGYAPGGPYDIFSRVVSKYLGKYIPGNPTVIIENKPGAASLLVANQVYHSEAKDGTVIGSFASGAPVLQVLGKPGVEFDGAKYNWLGSGAKTFSTCAARVDSGINSIQDIMGPNAKELVIGAIGPGTGNYDVPITINGAIGTKFKVVSGYDGTSKITLAVENKEVDGMCANLDTMQSSVRQLLDGPNPTMKFIIQMNSEPSDHPWLKGVPTTESLAQTEEAKLIMRAIASQGDMNLPYAVAPEVPKDRVEALRKALADTFADPQFKDDAQKSGFDVAPNSAEKLAEIVNQVLNMPPATAAKLKEILQ